MNKSTKLLLPSKKFMMSIVVIVLIILMFFIVKAIANSTSEKRSNTNITLGDITRSDLDKNGIPDWQDELYALQPDTLSPEERAIALQNPAFTVPSDNKTDQLAKDMYVIISSLSNGGTLDPAVKQNMTQMLTSYIENISTPRIWTTKDLTTAGNDISAIQQYVAEYSVLVALYKPAATPIPMLESAIELNDPEGLRQSLVRSINLHKDALTGLQSMTVPQKAIRYHLAIMNSIQNIHDDTENMGKYFEDPVLTFSAILGYNEHAQSLVDAINEINEGFFLPVMESSSY